MYVYKGILQEPSTTLSRPWKLKDTVSICCPHSIVLVRGRQIVLGSLRRAARPALRTGRQKPFPLLALKPLLLLLSRLIRSGLLLVLRGLRVGLQPPLLVARALILLRAARAAVGGRGVVPGQPAAARPGGARRGLDVVQRAARGAGARRARRDRDTRLGDGGGERRAGWGSGRRWGARPRD